MMRRALWIEDAAFTEAAEMAAPIYDSGTFELVIAGDATEAIRCIMESEFDAVIVDIRLYPGSDPVWIEMYDEAGSHVDGARLGIPLLHHLLNEKRRRPDIANWVGPEKFGVLTVENRREVEHDLEQLGITHFRQKTADSAETILLDLIEEIVNASNKEARSV